MKSYKFDKETLSYKEDYTARIIIVLVSIIVFLIGIGIYYGFKLNNPNLINTLVGFILGIASSILSSLLIKFIKS